MDFPDVLRDIAQESAPTKTIIIITLNTIKDTDLPVPGPWEGFDKRIKMTNTV